MLQHFKEAGRNRQIKQNAILVAIPVFVDDAVEIAARRRQKLLHRQYIAKLRIYTFDVQREPGLHQQI